MLLCAEFQQSRKGFESSLFLCQRVWQHTGWPQGKMFFCSWGRPGWKSWLCFQPCLGEGRGTLSTGPQRATGRLQLKDLPLLANTPTLKCINPPYLKKKRPVVSVDSSSFLYFIASSVFIKSIKKQDYWHPPALEVLRTPVPAFLRNPPESGINMWGSQPAFWLAKKMSQWCTMAYWRGLMYLSLKWTFSQFVWVCMFFLWASLRQG